MMKSDTLEDALLGIGWCNGALVLTGITPQWHTTAVCFALSFAICLYRAYRRGPHE